eukprot:Clim_evm36s240 gene=Clim_evmTU36s240
MLGTATIAAIIVAAVLGLIILVGIMQYCFCPKAFSKYDQEEIDIEGSKDSNHSLEEHQVESVYA